MSQAVNITISGLCLFTPGAFGRMVCLLPATGASAGDGSVPFHFPLLRYDAGLVESGAGKGLDITGLDVRFDLGDGALDPALARGVVDLRPYTRASVPRQLMAGDGGGAVAARVELTAGRMRSSGMLSCWTMRRPGHAARERVELTNAVVWTATLRDGAGPLALYGGALGAGESDPLVTFRDDVPVLDLTLSHDVAHEHGGVPPVGAQAEHFQAYRWLLDEYAAWQLPRFAGQGACNGAGGVFGFGGSPFSCMVAGVTPPP